MIIYHLLRPDGTDKHTFQTDRDHEINVGDEYDFDQYGKYVVYQLAPGDDALHAFFKPVTLN